MRPCFTDGVDVPLHPFGLTRTRRLTARDERAVLRFLGRHTSQHAYLLGLVARGALSGSAEMMPLVGWFERGSLGAVASLGANVVLSRASSPRGVAALAAHARELGVAVKVAVGPDPEIDQFLALFGREAVRLERAGQVLLEVDARHLARSARSMRLRPAQPEELDLVWHLDEDMILEELGFSPFEEDPQVHRHGCLRRIEERRTWVEGDFCGPLTFKVDHAAVSPQVVQLSGVFTPPLHRRRGIALQALGEMCHILLREVPRVSLYVNEDNAAARRVYRRLGFREIGRVRSAWLETAAER